MTTPEEEFLNLDPKSLSPEVAKVIFASEWDEAIDFYRHVAAEAGMEHEEWLALLNADKAILMKLVPLPRNMTLEKSRPYVELSDMLTLARVARYCFDKMDNLPLDLG
jgi:hypothetical protein